MQKGFVVSGMLKDNNFIELYESLPFENGEILVTVVPVEKKTTARVSGTWKGAMTMSDSFNEPLEEFMDYTG